MRLQPPFIPPPVPAPPPPLADAAAALQQALADQQAGAEPLVIALMGPTASGKTALAIDLAERLDLAVLSVDSRQLYRHMDVGTAKPTPAQRQRVRHELLDLRDPDNPITLQEFSVLAREAIAAEHRRRGIAFLVGGSGLYLQALLAGLEPPAVPPNRRCGPNSPAWARSAATPCCVRPIPPPPHASPQRTRFAPSGPSKFCTAAVAPSPASRGARRRPGAFWSWGSTRATCRPGSSGGPASSTPMAWCRRPRR